MKWHLCSSLLLSLALASTVCAQNDYYYVPRQAAPGEKTSPGSGVLVREIEIRKGDTLSGISRKFSGRGSYYPQILLFNGIRNPHLILEGERVRVPVSKQSLVESRASAPVSGEQNDRTSGPHGAAQPLDEIPLDELKHAPAKNHFAKAPGHKHRAETAADRKRFSRALRSYQRGEWHTAIKQFDAYLVRNPNSPLAADANLYKADCYLKLGTP